MKKSELTRIVAFFRPLGFFGGLGKSDAAVVEHILSVDDPWIDLASWAPESTDPRGTADLNVLAFDRARVWRLESYEILFDRRAKAEGYAYCSSYADVVGQLARIAAHRFRLSATGSKRGQLDVTCQRTRRRVTFRTDGQVFSPDVLRAVNEVIAPRDCRFVFVSNRYCTGFVTLLTRDEEARIVGKRRWQLDTLE